MYANASQTANKAGKAQVTINCNSTFPEGNSHIFDINFVKAYVIF
jgi:hypothetical protein